MPRTLEIYVVPRNHRWEVCAGGVTRRHIDWLCTKERAVEHAVERGHELVGSDTATRMVVVIERADGTVEEQLTFH